MKPTKSCFKLIFLSVIVLCLVLSCNKTDDDIAINKFSFDSFDYETSHGRILYQGVWNKTGSYSIVLMTSGLDNTIEGYKGEGDMISFWLLSSDSTKILPGVYVFDKNTLGDKNICDNILGTPQSSTSVQIGIALGYKPATDNSMLSCDFWGWANEGIVTINSIENNVFDLDYSFKIYDGRNVTGHYQGEILTDK